VQDKLIQEDMQPLIASLLGILLTLNLTGDINLQNNFYMQELAKLVPSPESQEKF
jgi:hypothetical protein